MTNILQNRGGGTQGNACSLDVVGAQCGIMNPAGKKRGKKCLELSCEISASKDSSRAIFVICHPKDLLCV